MAKIEAKKIEYDIVLAGRIDGLGARLGTILNGIRLAQQYQLSLEVAWWPLPRWHGYVGDISDVFSEEFTSLLRPVDLGVGLREWGAAKYPNARILFTEQGLRHINKNTETDVFVRSELSRIFRALPFTPRIRSAIQEIDAWAERYEGTHLFGIHMRYGDMAQNILRFFPTYLPIEVYAGLIEKLNSSFENPKIFLASNDLNQRQALEDRFGTLNFQDVINLEGFNSLQRDFLEMYILSRCNRIYGHKQSAHSTFASTMGDIELVTISEYMFGGDIAGALRSMLHESASQVTQGAVKSLITVGMDLIGKGQAVAAAEVFRAVLSLAPNDATANYGLLKARSLSGVVKEGDEEYGAALGAVLNQPNPIAVLGDILSQAPSEKGFVELAKLLIAENQLKQAQAKINKGLMHYPDSVSLLMLQGTVLRRRKNFTKAESSFQRAFSIDSSRFDLLHDLGLSAESRGDWEAALDRWDLCLRLFPNNAFEKTWRSRRAEALLMLGQCDEAEQAFRDLTMQKDDGLRLIGLMGLARTAKVRHDWLAAVEAWGACLKAFPTHEGATNWRVEVANAWLESEHLTEAEVEFQAALKDDPNHVGARAGMARLAEKQGRVEEAIERFKACLATFPNHPRVVRWRGSIASLWLRLGELDRAESEFRHLAEQYPDNSVSVRGLERVRRQRKISNRI